ncbi:hypothetical protein KSE_71470 [Kitasatospora setae KM-6054]|uniref:Transposase n=1 Tax=Kitasatospora setae (strain ATCC 33774 / DSM 43861 / JCM 3304 / KCC A-0304 / NBRC 14216 / KM-6054) TaxID=452652 RepID=E4NIV5_KITSK|nr:hypothetical protein KSE_71470 [Kitasatospora setae KM-6054]
MAASYSLWNQADLISGSYRSARSAESSTRAFLIPTIIRPGRPASTGGCSRACTGLRLLSRRVANDEPELLQLLAAHRTDLVADRTRTVNRLRGLLTDVFPALDRALDLTNAGPLTLLTGCRTPAAQRRLGAKRLETWPRNRGVRSAGQSEGKRHTQAVLASALPDAVDERPVRGRSP